MYVAYVKMDRMIDIVVGSPERMIQHKEKGNVYFSKVTHVIIDEVDTMLTQGFGADIRAILRSVLGRNISNTLTSSIKDSGSSDGIQYEIEQPPLSMSNEPNSDIKSLNYDSSNSVSSSINTNNKIHTHTVPVPPATPAQLIMATATLTKAVKALLTDVNGAFNIEFNGKFVCCCLVLSCLYGSFFQSLE